MAGLFDFLSGLGNMLGAATYTRPQDIQAVRGLLPQSVDTTLANTLQSPAANDALGVVGGMGPAVGAIRAFHGSPYDFNKFDMSKVGTGEGAQAYGHGLYFAENPAVAESYKGLSPKGATAAEMNARRTLADFGGDTQAAIAKLRQRAINTASADWISKQHSDAADLLESGNVSPGRMYEVNINAEPEQFLDWDKPVKDQSEAVRKLYHYLPVGNESPGSFYFTTKPEFAQKIQAAGIPGIKYLDQFSRNTGAGTSNYVVFNPGLIDILKKYGLLGTLGGLGAASAYGDNK